MTNSRVAFIEVTRRETFWQCFVRDRGENVGAFRYEMEWRQNGVHSYCQLFRCRDMAEQWAHHERDHIDQGHHDND